MRHHVYVLLGTLQQAVAFHPLDYKAPRLEAVQAMEPQGFFEFVGFRDVLEKVCVASKRHGCSAVHDRNRWQARPPADLEIIEVMRRSDLYRP